MTCSAATPTPTGARWTRTTRGSRPTPPCGCATSASPDAIERAVALGGLAALRLGRLLAARGEREAAERALQRAAAEPVFAAEAAQALADLATTGVTLMIEPFSLGALGAIALTDGIKFLYAQAGEILKRRRERTATPIPAPGLLEGELAPLQLDPAAIDERTAELRSLRQRLTDIVEDIEPAEETDGEVVAATLALREAIESIVGQRITFRGEQREPSGTTITGRVRAREIHGRASGVDYTGTPTGNIDGEVVADITGAKSDIAGARITPSG